MYCLSKLGNVLSKQEFKCTGFPIKAIPLPCESWKERAPSGHGAPPSRLPQLGKVGRRGQSWHIEQSANKMRVGVGQEARETRRKEGREEKGRTERRGEEKEETE